MIPPLPTFIPRKPIRYRPRGQNAPAPTPPPPPAPAVVIDAFLTEGGETVTLVFDKPVTIQAPFNFADGSIQFSDHDPVGVSVGGVGGNSLEFNPGTIIEPGSGWAINGQPAWLTTVVAVPQGGSFPE